MPTLKGKKMGAILAVVISFVAIASAQLPPPGGGSGTTGSSGSTGGGNPPDWNVVSKKMGFLGMPYEPVQVHLGGSSYSRSYKVYDPDLSIDLNNPISGGIYPARYEHRASFSLTNFQDTFWDTLYGSHWLEFLSTEKADNFGVVTANPFPLDTSVEFVPAGASVSGGNTSFTIYYKCPIVTELTTGDYVLTMKVRDLNPIELLNDTKEWEEDENNPGIFHWGDAPEDYRFAVAVSLAPPPGGEESKNKK